MSEFAFIEKKKQNSANVGSVLNDVNFIDDNKCLFVFFSTVDVLAEIYLKIL